MKSQKKNLRLRIKIEPEELHGLCSDLLDMAVGSSNVVGDARETRIILRVLQLFLKGEWEEVEDDC